MEKGIFVTGSDTGVGKTVVAGAIAAAIKEQGLDVGVMKPVSTGAKVIGRKLVSEDAMYLKKIIGCTDDDDLVNPIRLSPASAPTLAATETGITLDLDKVWDAFKQLRSKHEFVVVEGIGGLMVPVDDNHLVADMILKMDLAIVVASKHSLGSINHTLLTVECAKNRNIRVKGIIINMLRDGKEFVEEIRKFSSVPVLGTIPFKEDVNVGNCTFGDIVEHFRRDVNISRIMRKDITE
ncbi:MAG: dethiobiotin synthase [Candidatus Scalinduaceae bacterium]